MIRYLLDSNIVSEPVRQRPDSRVQTHYEAHGHELAIPSVVWQELLYGLERMEAGRKRDFLADYLLDVIATVTPIFPFDTAAAEWLARERARLETLGRRRPVLDGMIAAVAATRGLILVTRNTADFDGFDGLHIENWFEEE